ncbi:MAG: amidohydrolase family protein [Candidatus Marinimicrobia bacterium]|nr:amidohydrolase family protein [Candidatus Neomarinimicrobiota bacterium]
MSDHYILINGIVTDGHSFLHENCEIEIKGNKILRIGKSPEISNDQVKKIDLGGRLVLPGLLNPHHHLYSALATGLAPVGPTNNFQQILENLWWHLDKTLGEESIYYSAMNGLMQSARYGVTTIIDHHASMSTVGGSLNIIKKAFEEVGVKGVLCYEVSDRMGEASLQKQIDENINFWTENQNSTNIQGLLGLHANFTLSEKTMKSIAKQKPEALAIHTHCGEDLADFQFCKDQGYEGPVHRLKEFGLLSQDALLAHCIHLSEKDHEILREIQPRIISNPESNANNNVGQMDMHKISKYVLGTDGMTGNILGTMRSHFLQRSGNIPNPLKVLFQYTAEMMNGYFPNTGELKVDGIADLAITNYHPVTPISMENLFYHLMFGVQGKEMHMTISEGKIIFSDNKIHSVDEGQMNKEIAVAVKKLHEKYYA